jgi:hypothetical protein
MSSQLMLEELRIPPQLKGLIHILGFTMLSTATYLGNNEIYLLSGHQAFHHLCILMTLAFNPYKIDKKKQYRNTLTQHRYAT